MTDEVHIPLQSSENTSPYNDISASVKIGNFEELQNYLQENGADTILNSRNDEGQTPLHDACSCGKRRTATRMVTEIVFWYSNNKCDQSKLFLDQQDNEGNTALHYAAKNKNRQVVEKLLRLGADVNLGNREGREGICLIYEHVPEVMISLLEKGDHIKFVENRDDPFEEEWNIECDFCLITGIGNDPNEIFETYMLSNVFILQTETQAKILNHPIVQLFLDLKWSKMKHLIYLLIGIHIIWSVFTVTYIMAVFHAKYGNRTADRIQFNGNPYFSNSSSAPSVLLFLLTFLMFIKETIEVFASMKIKTYYMEIENVGQWTLILLIFAILNIGWIPNVPDWVDFTMSIIAVFLSCLLIIGQMTYFPSLGIYMEIFMKVFKNFSKFLISFCPIVFAFACVFRMLMPMKTEFQLWPPWGIPKSVAMMTGEINFDDIFQDELFTVMITKTTLILLFLMIVTLVLQNLLIGLVVSDMEGLETKAKLNSIRTQLEQLYLVEAFIVSLGNILRHFHVRNTIEQSIMITKNGNHIVTRKTKDFSIKVQKNLLQALKQKAEDEFLVQYDVD